MINNNRKKIIKYLLILVIAFTFNTSRVLASITLGTTPTSYESGTSKTTTTTTSKKTTTAAAKNTQLYSCFTSGNKTCYGTLVKGEKTTSGIKYSGGTYTYTEKYIKVTDSAGNTKKLDAMCIDPEKNIKADSTYTCTKIETRYGPSIYATANYLSNKFGLDTLQKDLVYRILAKAVGNSQANSGNISTSIGKYLDSWLVSGNGLSNVPTKVHDAALSAVNIYYLNSGVHPKRDGKYVTIDPGFTYTISESESDYDKNEFKVYVTTKNPEYLIPSSTISFKAIDINDKNSTVGTVDNSSISFDFSTGKGSFTLKLRDSKYCSGIKIVATETYKYISDSDSGYTYKCCPGGTSNAQCLIVNIGGSTTTSTKTKDYTTEIDSFCKHNTCSDIPGKTNKTKNIGLCNNAKTSGIYSGTCTSNASSSDWYDNSGNKLKNYDAWVAACTKPTCNTIPSGTVKISGKSVSTKDACNSYKNSGTLLGDGTCTVVSALNGNWYDNNHKKLSNYSAWVKACTTDEKKQICKVPSNQVTYCNDLKNTRTVTSCATSSDGKWYDADGNSSDTNEKWLETCTKEKESYSCSSIPSGSTSVSGTETNNVTLCENISNKKSGVQCTETDTNGVWYDDDGNSLGTGEDGYNNWVSSCTKAQCSTKITTPEYCDEDDEDSQKITIESPTDITTCVLKEKDDAGNTYQDTTAVAKSNSYCSVYCKENYEMKLPSAQYTNSGEYFKTGSVTVTAERTCYTAGPEGKDDTNIDIDGFISDIIDAQKELIAVRDEYLKAVAIRDTETSEHSSSDCSSSSTYYSKKSVSYTGIAVDSCNSTTGVCSYKSVTNQTGGSSWWGTKLSSSKSCTTTSSSSTQAEPDFQGNVDKAEASMKSAVSKIKSLISDMETCYKWTNSLYLDPEVDFDYDETYSSDINFEQTSKSVNNNAEVTYKSGKGIDNKYTATVSGDVLEDVNYTYCDASGCSNSNDDTKATKISTLNKKYYYVKKVSKGTATYENTTQYATNYPHGTLETVSDKSKLKKNYSYLGAVFPVALKTTTGVYNWTLNFTNVGQYNDQANKGGRLNDVQATLNKNISNDISSDIGYVCVYVVDCPDCDYECKCPENLPDGYTCKKSNKFTCEIDGTPTCTDCDVYCKNCIFDGNDTYSYRTVSLTNLFPNTRNYGYNWSNEKGQATQTEIEKSGNDAYTEAQYSYTITPANMQSIRDYNKTVGTYTNDTLTYHAKDNYDNVYGTSSFLDDGKANGYFTENKRNTSWTLWSSVSVEDGIGPSWK